MSAIARINRTAFEHNVRRLIQISAPADVWVAVKANAYGHGMVELAEVALTAGATGLAVLDVPSAVTLRSSGITAPLFVWLHGADTDFDVAVDLGLEIGVSTVEQLAAAARATGIARVHLKIDTGLHRNGFVPQDWAKACHIARQLEQSGDIIVSGIWSHLADTSEAADTQARDVFIEALSAATAAGLTPEFVHLAASSAAISEPESRFGVVRIGIAAYGISPFDDRDGHDLGLAPVMTLSSTIIDINGETATVDAGWADGVPQAHSGTASVSVNGVFRQVTHIEAHHCDVLIGEHPVHVGDSAIIFGEGGPSAEQWANWTGTIGDEIVTSVPAHVRRVSN